MLRLPPLSTTRLPTGPDAWLLLAMLFALLAGLGGVMEPAVAAPASTNVSAGSSPSPQPLSGDYQLGPATLVDAPPGEPRDAVLRLHLTGRSAADLYRALPGKVQRDECLDDGSVSKTQGEILCMRSPKGAHECWVGIDLKHKRLAHAFVC